MITVKFDWNDIDERAADSITSDLFHTLLGKKLGSGCYRVVYQHASNPELVVKVETGTGNFSNVLENDLWESVQYQKEGLSKWLAPVEYISPNGRVLIQKKTTPCKMEDMPAKIPGILNLDTKLQNWGWYDGRIVCHDYAGHAAIYMANKSTALRKADWWQ